MRFTCYRDRTLGPTIIARLAAELKIVQDGEATEVRMRFPLAAG